MRFTGPLPHLEIDDLSPGAFSSAPSPRAAFQEAVEESPRAPLFAGRGDWRGLGWLPVLVPLVLGCASPEAASEAGPASAPLEAEAVPAAATAFTPAATDLQVHFIDVGTGDCIWIQTANDGIPGNDRLEGLNVVIDGGGWGQLGRVNGYSFASEYLVQGLPSTMVAT